MNIDSKSFRGMVGRRPHEKGFSYGVIALPGSAGISLLRNICRKNVIAPRTTSFGITRREPC